MQLSRNHDSVAAYTEHYGLVKKELEKAGERKKRELRLRRHVILDLFATHVNHLLGVRYPDHWITTFDVVDAMTVLDHLLPLGNKAVDASVLGCLLTEVDAANKRVTWALSPNIPRPK